MAKVSELALLTVIDANGTPSSCEIGALLHLGQSPRSDLMRAMNAGYIEFVDAAYNTKPRWRMTPAGKAKLEELSNVTVTSPRRHRGVNRVRRGASGQAQTRTRRHGLGSARIDRA